MGISKSIIIAMLSIVTLSIYSSEVFYCVDDDVTGFIVAENYKPTTFEIQTFKAKIDFENEEIVSSDLIFLGYDAEYCTSWEDVLFCNNGLGTSFSISRLNLEYHRSSVFKTANQTDDIFVAHGSCENF